MSDAPERISVYPLEGTWGYGGMEFAEGDEPCLVEYVRADRIEELEAKLAKAVETLEYYAVEALPWDDDDSLLARTTLAELEGETK